MKVRKAMPKVFLLVAMLLLCGMASAQVVVKGNVYGGCELGKVNRTGDGTGNTSVTINGGSIEGTVYGGGDGSMSDEKAGWVQGNSTVTMTAGTVYRSVYGGGYCGSVGNFTNYSGYEYYYNDSNQKIDSIQLPTVCTSGTGTAKVDISGGFVGQIGTSHGSVMPTSTSAMEFDDVGYVFGGSAGVGDSIHYRHAPAMGVVDSTYVYIHGGLMSASVYGGCENGLVLRHTRVRIEDGQIGSGYRGGNTWDGAYDETKWTAAITAVKNGTIADALGTGGSLENYFHECDRWGFDSPYEVYDYYFDSAYTTGGQTGNYTPAASDNIGHNGHTFFGHVFGGGSGYYPIAPGVWRYRAGQVNGNTNVEITGGHILSNVYGGNEYTDVKGTSKVTMTGGTVGIPRTTDQIIGCPVNGYIFCAGMGDPRTAFNTWTNVDSTNVSINGGVVFSSVYGGGEEGHVLRHTHVTIDETAPSTKPTIIGTYGFLEFEGNVFGAGRGFTRLALTAGTIGGNSQIDIKGGTMLGSIYGGGSMASVGTFFTDHNNTNYGQMQSGSTHGYTTINITGGTIGNDHEAVYHPDFNTLSKGGNVFGGSKGSFTLLGSNDVNSIWLNLAKVKHTSITINESDHATNIKGNVYGGGEFGTVAKIANEANSGSTNITISAGTIWRDVYGGGHGSDNTSTTATTITGTTVTLPYSPLEHAGRVYGNTNISISGTAWIKKCVYGGGEIASVGSITNCEATTLTQSWPYKFAYADNTGETVITVTGGRIGLTGKDYFGPWNYIDSQWKPVYYDNSGVAHVYTNDNDLKNACIDNGDIYGGSKGRVVPATHLHHMGNVRKTTISINIPTLAVDPTTPDNYKPTTGDAGITNANIGYATGLYPTWTEWTALANASRSCITGAVYAGAEEGHVNEDTKVTLTYGLVGHAIYGGGKGKAKDGSGNYILTAGKVYGNTEINIENDGCYVVRSVFGGGNLASVGKGNYIGLTGGESEVTGDLLTAVKNSGIATINITGGQLGMLPVQPASGNPDPSSVVKDGIPYGSVFGGGRGQVVSNNISDDFFAFVNDTYIKIGEDGSSSTTSPLILGSVYGGGQDGHVRRNTHVTVNGGEIGVEYISSINAMSTMGNDVLSSDYWTTRGNVYGGGSGISKIQNGNYTVIAGSVHDSTNVTINGGLIHRNVHGGGSMAFVDKHAKVTVNSNIGKADVTNGKKFNDFQSFDYGGYVFGAGRGSLETEAGVNLAVNATTGSTEVNLTEGTVPGDVYGGGAMGQVVTDTKVNISGGQVGIVDYNDTHTGYVHLGLTGKGNGSVYGGGMGDKDHVEAARVKRNTDVTISGGHVYYNVYGGGKMASVGQRELTYSTPEDPNSTLLSIDPVASTGLAQVTVTGGQVGPAPITTPYNIPCGLNGEDGYVFGGGKGIGDDEITNTFPFGQYFQIADVNNTLVTINIDMAKDSTANRIWGSVFGGSEDGHVLDSTRVKYISGYTGTKGTTSWDGNIFGGGRNFHHKNYAAGRVQGNVSVYMCGGHLLGSIFGGGRYAITGCGFMGFNLPDNQGRYTAMLDGNDHGNITVKVNGGTIGNPNVIETFTQSSMGDVFGGGKGDMEGIALENHPKASALLLAMTKNTTVIIADSINGTTKVSSPRILGSVFGGGEVANVGNYRWKTSNTAYLPSTETIGDIEAWDVNGVCNVTVSGGTIGADKAQMRLDMASTNPTDHNYNLKYNDDRGHVFGGGEGLSGANPYDSNSPVINPYSGEGDPGILNNKRLLDLMATVRETHVTISDSAFVKGSVYGGSMSGHVLNDAKVTVSGGQIGAGYYVINSIQKDSLYNPAKFFNPFDYFTTEFFTAHPDANDILQADALHGCVSWTYTAENQRPFNPIDIKAGRVPTNGETWFGHVFGGGSGYYPYIIPVPESSPARDTAIWNPDAGKVYGHTEVEITGGHILTNVYGGCQTTDVGNYVVNSSGQLENNSVVPQVGINQAAKAIVTMSGGTVGVPEQKSSIQAFPYTGNVYGGGQGNFSDHLKALNNVDSTRVTISDDALVYGMVFGGSQNGHVIDSTKVLVKGGVIGITGLSGYDGSVFGGGQGSVYYNEATHDDTLYAHAGRVGGNTRIIMSGGKALGNLYGGGLVALTGVDLEGWFDAYTNSSVVYDSTNHGLCRVELTGGFVGNGFNHGLNLLKNNLANGNVYGGGRGKLDEYHQDDLARSANAAVTISGNPTIYGSVYGGGEMANVGYWRGYDLGWYATQTAATRVKITGSPKIGTEIEFKDTPSIAYSHDPGNWTYYDTIRFVKYATESNPVNDTAYLRMLTHTRTGHVFGGGQGEVKIVEPSHTVMGLEQGHCSTTNVYIGGTPTIRGSVFGGSEEGVVWGETKVHIAGGTIGTDTITPDSLRYNHSTHSWSAPLPNPKAIYSYGNVYGGSYGKDYYQSFNSLHISNPRQTMIDSVNILSGRVYGNTRVDITGGAIRGNVYGGGDMASVGIWDSVTNSNGDFIDIKPIADSHRPAFRGNTTVNVSGSAVIGPLDGTGLNAYVFGGGKGFSSDPDQLRTVYCNVDSTFVTVSGGTIWGSVFGGGNDAHVLGSTSVTVHNGANIGTNGLSTWDGNIFGGGRNFQNSNHSNGRVAGNIKIEMDGGTIQGSIFGGGRLALTGVNMSGNPYVTDHVYDSAANGKTIHGLVTINVSGITTVSGDNITYSTSIGNPDGDKLLNGSDESVGDIFGSGKGDTKAYEDIWCGRVANTKINVTGSPRIYGSVFGGGEMAGIGYWYEDNGKAKFYDHSGSSEVTIGSSGSSASQSNNLLIGTNYEFDPEYLLHSNHNWTVYDEATGTVTHTCTGNVFGGSQGDVDITAPHWVSMGRSRKAKVTVNGGNIMSRVFGGAEQGSIATNTEVTINGGIIGTLVTKPNSTETYYMGGVYGGGYGSHKAELNVTHPNDSSNVRSDSLAGRVYGNILVDVLGGTIRGNVYGGASYAYIGGYGASPHGDVQLNIGSPAQAEAGDLTKGTTILGSVFGANNHSGTPYGNVRTDIYHTKHTTENTAPSLPEGYSEWDHDLLLKNASGEEPFTFAQQYALKEVYGGGNKASFTPNATRGYRSATVYVHYCENTIKDLYGGGKSADIGTSSVDANSSLQVEGGRFYRIFGGGNGSLGNPLVAANTYGTALTNIRGGVIQEVYGGNNQYGNINTIDLRFNDPTQICTEYVDEIFAGSNESPLIGDIVADLNCGEGSRYDFFGGTHNAVTYGNITLNVYGGTTTNVYGGSKGTSSSPADIKKFPSSIPNPLPQPGDEGYDVVLDSVYRYMQAHSDLHLEGTGGNITVNLYGGTIENVYGGCSVNGNVEGDILINVIDVENVNCPLDVTNIYGGGEGASYAPTDHTTTSPIVNVVHVKETLANSSVTPPIPYIPGIRGNVFGGGKGEAANVTTNPQVNIGYNASHTNTFIDAWKTAHSSIKPRVLIQGNVYGGGKKAKVYGNTNVNMYAGVVGDSIGRIKSHVNPALDSVFYGLYAYELEGGRVFGGGEGSDSNKDHGLVTGNATVTMTGGKVYRTVYGGGEMASIGQGILSDKNSGVTTVRISGGEIGPLDGSGLNAYVYGGSRGKDDDEYELYADYANVDSTSVIVCDSARIYGSIFGGGSDGHVLGDARVQLLGKTGTRDTIPVIGTNGLTSWDGNIFGGGRNYKYSNLTAGRVGGNIRIDMSDGVLKGNVYGGGRMGLTGMSVDEFNTVDTISGFDHGYVTINISGGTVGSAVDLATIGNVFGGGKGLVDNGDGGAAMFYQDLARVKNTQVNISGQARIFGSVYGGGELAKVCKNTGVTVSGGVVGSELSGPRNNGSVFGGGKGYYGIATTLNDAGEVWGNSNVRIEGGQVKENVYGGGEIACVGQMIADFYSDVEINWNSVASVIVTGGEIGPLDGTGNNGFVYGGGQGKGDDPSNEYKLLGDVSNTSVVVSDSAVVHASVFGGGSFGHVLGNTSVLVEKGLNTDDETPLIGTDGMHGYDGNIFGGGQGDGTNYANGRVGGNTTVEMTHGTVYGNIYGGGRLALTGVDMNGTMQSGTDHGNTKVMIKGGTVGNNTSTNNTADPAETVIETFTWFSMGNIYGGGKGLSMDPAPTSAEKALLLGLTKNTSIEISDTLGNNTHVYGIVLGGGEIANVGKYTLSKEDPDDANKITNIAVTDGATNVRVGGGIIGGNRSQMRYDLEQPTVLTNWYSKYNDDLGYVYGGGEGWSANPAKYISVGDTSLVDLVATVQRTEVTITNDTTKIGGAVSRPWVKASVFGGSESGHVKGNTKVTIAGGQIGAGTSTVDGKPVDLPMYTDGSNGTTNRYINPLTNPVTTTPTDNTLVGTYHWDYAEPHNPYDPAKIRNQYNTTTNTYGYVPCDGKSWFGNVFGGGSGWFPYVVDTSSTSQPKFESRWNPLSGKVWGNTTVEIKGGHILNNVYGGNEMTDVGGKATVIMSGGTVGVPRTAEQVALQPVICYVFGGGCGDPRDIFYDKNNVAETDVQITGGIIYGSVFGGAEDGHILGDASVTVSQPTGKTTVIGSTGKSGADGNIFGGGRNFLHENYTAGRVGGNIDITMTGGTLLGNVFGGGRLGITGVDASGYNITENPAQHGNVTIDIKGGTVGNARYLNLTNTPDLYTNEAHKDTLVYTGHVFGGGKGIQVSGLDAYKLARVKNTEVKISETDPTNNPTRILGNVYGGGELANVGWVTEPGTNYVATTGGLAKIDISGGRVGWEQIGQNQVDIVGGNVYGGGLGLAGGLDVLYFANVDTTRVEISNTAYITGSVFGGADNGHVWRNTSIEMTNGIVGQPNTLDELTVDANEQPTTDHIYSGSVIGGGRGTTPIATTPVTIFHDTTGIVFGNATVEIKGNAKVRHGVYGGGGLSHVGTFTRNASTNEITFTNGGKCTVYVAGDAHIGPTKDDLVALAGDDNDNKNTFFNMLGANAGWVFGAGCGLAGLSDLTFNDSTLVTIAGNAQVTGAVFGGGENGHVLDSTHVIISGGTIGGIPLHEDDEVNITEGAFSDISFTATTNELTEDRYGSGPRVFRGIVYGGGKGNDTIADPSDKLVYDRHAGQVYGKSKVEIKGGTIYNRVFGGGLLSSVGTFQYAAAPLNTDSIIGVVGTGPAKTGLAKVIVSGGYIGNPDDNTNNGDVFGGGRGLVGRHWEPTYLTGDQVVNLAYVGNTEVTIKNGATIYGNVFGGSGSGHVQEDAHVIVEGGTIGIAGHGGWHSNVYGGGGGQHQYQRTPTTTHHSITSGRVFGNTTVEIKGGEIKHNVYGGGAIASVGTYNIYASTMEGLFKPGTGDTEVTITGGIIGVDGNENGMVFGSGRGQIDSIGAFMDSLSFAVKTVVNIGKEGSSTGPMVHGSVYGSGENGHVFEKATVNVYSGTIGTSGEFNGNVYGAGCGTDMYDSDGNGSEDSYNPRSGMVYGNTEVNIKGGTIKHNVYGGGAMALVGTYLPYVANGTWGNAAGITGLAPSTGKTVVNVSGGTIGTDGVNNGNVYGGSRGPGSDDDGFDNMALTDTCYVFISGTADVKGSVYGGGAKSWTRTARVATVSGGTVAKNVFGGGENGIATNTPFTSIKTANVRGGHILGNVFGGSYIADEKTSPVGTWETGYNYWSSFVNVTGGTIDGNVYAAGYGGEVDGSVCVNIGLTAVNSAPTNTTQTGSTQANIYRYAGLGSSSDLVREKLKIGGDIFGGSYVHQTGGAGQPAWDHDFDITGYSTLFIDGDEYETTSTDESVANYMNIGGGIYGSGNYCESGAKGRTIILRRYGTRNNNADNELLTATRSLTTIQRGGIVLIDSTNVNLTGKEDISGQYPFKKFGVLQVDLSLFVANGSGIVLGEPSSKAEVFMDSIRSLRSLYLENGLISYNQMGSDAHWQMVGIKDNNDKLYRIQISGSDSTVYGGSELDKVKENVIIFNGTSRLWVRYNDKATGTRKYGELYGFFRMRQPFPVTILENFAEARPKLTSKNNHIEPYTAGSTWNQGDGGFLSYVSSENDFTTVGHTTWFDYPVSNDDGGLPYTNTRQYPYLNIGSFSKEDHYQDMETYRVWAKPTTMAHKWYVDGRGIGIGTGGWGQDKTHGEGWGDYPDKPKLTVSGAATGGSSGGICIDNSPNQSGHIFDPSNDIIFVVGPINASLENTNLNQRSDYPLRLYRYPGGHKMSNDSIDVMVSSNLPNPNVPTSTEYNGLATGVKLGPGANLGAMINANKTSNFVMDSVFVNGLYEYDAADAALYNIPESFATEKLNVSEPLVVTTSGSTTTLKGGTTLTNGYNNVDAGATTAWYNNPDYVAAAGVHDGGALYVDENATVKVEGLVNITGNKQKKGSGDPIECNVYLPTFSKSLTISNSLDENTHIGVTSPIRNKAASYVDNTFSPVAVAVTPTLSNAPDTARCAWENGNFHDDLDWFFINGNKTTYYQPTSLGKATNGNTLYFGWTWANVVRKEPATHDLSDEVTDDFSYTNINSAYDLAWLISKSAGMNGQTATDFHDVTAITQTADIDLNKYVWVPIGKKEEAIGDKAFASHYDGKGHLITNLNIEYIGIGDRIYERNEYGLFGAVKNGTVNRTFVVDGKIRPAAKSESSKAALDESYLPEAPEGDTLINNEVNLEDRAAADASEPYNIGGLVGYLSGSAIISNSEAAITVPFVNNDSLVVGGLVGLMKNGTVHSSMAMPYVHEMNVSSKGLVGGLVGSVEGGQIKNSFASNKFGFGGQTSHIKIGGLVGENAGANMSNCYVALRLINEDYPYLTTSNFGSLAAINSSGTIDYCYSMKYSSSNLSTVLDYTFTIAGDGGCSYCSRYTPTMSSDVYGYMYSDNIIPNDYFIHNDTAMFGRLNKWVIKYGGSGYARWARPALPEINGDLPVLLLDELGSSGPNNHEGDFRSVATIKDSPALQYGGPVRDGEASSKNRTPANELDAAIERMEAGDALFVYGDIVNAVTADPAEKTKISIQEDVSILHAGSLASYDSTYVGITFDNSFGAATSTQGINYGLNGLGMGGYPLPRDWHMFSSPLSNAPLGFDYKTHNVSDGPYNNPWDGGIEFSWLNGGAAGNKRYWMKGWENSQSQNGHLTEDTGDGWVDGYFPSRVANAGTNVTGFGFSEGCINESWASEYGLYPYGMDFYTWTEPDYHWINFKRNGPNHWKSDGEHENIAYKPLGYVSTEYPANEYPAKQNEDNLIVGRGYMAAIATETFMQSHGMLNTGEKTIPLTNTSTSKLPGWNLVGNPFHGYLDFDKLAKHTDNASVLSHHMNGSTDEGAFYVVYNADKYKNNDASTAFRYYPVNGSSGGDYAERYLHPHQGFYVRAKEGSTPVIGSLTFTQDMLATRDTVATYGGGSHFRGEQPAYPLVNLYLSSDKGCADVTVIEFERPEWGGATKMKELRSGNGLFYAHHDNHYYAACFAQEGTDRVPLWFEAKEDDIFTIKWNTANGNFHSMYLIDNLTGIQYDMLRNDTYTFEGHKNDYWSRFLIVFNVTDVDENFGHEIFAFFDGSEWVVTGAGELEFVDVLGHVLMHTRINDGQTRVRLPKVASGVYLMRLTNGEQCRVQKVFVNNK